MKMKRNHQQTGNRFNKEKICNTFFLKYFREFFFFCLSPLSLQTIDLNIVINSKLIATAN